MKNSRPASPDKLIALLRQAIALHNAQRLAEADEIYKKVLLQSPRHPDALHLRALVFHAGGRFRDAAAFAGQAIAAAPHVANFHNTAGEAWRRLDSGELAEKHLREAIRLDPGMAMAHLNLSLLLGAQGRLDQARESVERALALRPDYPEALAQALSLCCAAHEHAGAAQLAARLEAYLDAHAGDRVAAEALGRYRNYLAREHLKHRRFADAAAENEKAMALFPGFWGNWAVRAELAGEALDFSAAELHCAIAANLASDNEDARLNLGHVLLEQKRLDEARSHYAGWLAAHPDSAAARFGLAAVCLLRGEFEAGWDCYESRWGVRRHGGGARYDAAPQWEGDACDKLLLYAEQGLGDTIQMLRFLPQVRSRCRGRVTLLVPAPLLRIARRADGADGVQVTDQLPADAAFDRACPLMSLPRVLRAHSAERLGIERAYLAPDRARQAFFDTIFRGLPGRKIGVVWQGSAAGASNRRRPLPLDALAPLLEVPGISLVSLQYGVKQPSIGGTPIRDIADHLHDFDDLAAAMAALDAVISVDTGPSHLAGALGMPVYTLVPWLHDWRWGAEGERSYWYPDMVLVRQTDAKNWDRPLATLGALLRGQTPAETPPAAARFPDAASRSIRHDAFPFVRLDCGGAAIRLPLLDGGVTRMLLLDREHAARERDLLAPYLPPGGTAIDAGAHAGAAAVLLARALGPDGRVIAIEPDRIFHECLEDNVRSNAVPWVEARRQAAAQRNGKLAVAVRDPAAAGATQSRPATEPVTAIALDSLRLEACSLLRIDAPGRELEVLEGARALLERARPALRIAGVGTGAPAPLCRFLKARGYRVFRPRAWRSAGMPDEHAGLLALHAASGAPLPDADELVPQA